MAGGGAPKTVGAKPNTKTSVLREVESSFRARDHSLERTQPLDEAPAVCVHDRAMADLASRSRIFPVVVHVRARNGEQCFGRRQTSEQVEHRGVAPRPRVAEWPAQNCAQVIL